MDERFRKYSLLKEKKKKYNPLILQEYLSNK